MAVCFNCVTVGLILFTAHKKRINILKVYTGNWILVVTNSQALHHDFQYLHV